MTRALAPEVMPIMDKSSSGVEKPTIAIDTKGEKPKLDSTGDLFSPSNNAPELIPASPSTYAPQVVDDYPFKHAYIHHGEDKILSAIQYPEEKILSPASHVNNGIQVVDTDGLEVVNSPTNEPRRRLSKRQSIGICVLVTIIIVVVSVGAWIGVRKHGRANKSALQSNIAGSNATGMAALYWMNADGDKHYGVYYQNASGTVMELSYDSINGTWKTDEVTNSTHNIRPGTSLAAAAGWPHANYSYTLVGIWYRK